MTDAAIIVSEQRPIPEKEGTDLILWLSKPEAETLRRVVSSKVKDELAEATNALLQAAGDAPLKVNIAERRLLAARRYSDFLSILNEIRNQTTPFTVTKWS